MTRPRGRRSGGLDTRGAIIAEARRQFAEAGYAPTTLRSIAAGAGVDHRLVLHYFGSKEGLFRAALELPMEPELVVGEAGLQGGAEDLGLRLGRAIVSVVDDPRSRLVLIGLLRAAVADPEAAALIREVLTDRLLLPIARGIGADHPELRASLLGSQVVGLVAARYIVAAEPLASAPGELLIRALAPVVTHYLTAPWPEVPGPG